MGYEAKKTEHNGSKKGNGAYWGLKADAKRESNRHRREDDKKAAKEESDASSTGRWLRERRLSRRSVLRTERSVPTPRRR